MIKHKEQCNVNMVILECEKCKFIATKARSLELHRTVHITQKPYNCADCEYQTSDTSSYNGHIITHNKDQPYHCPHCSLCFGEIGNLKRHVKTQHPYSVMKCDQCSYLAYLQTEMNIHRQQCNPDKKQE